MVNGMYHYFECNSTYPVMVMKETVTITVKCFKNLKRIEILSHVLPTLPPKT